MRPFYDSFYAKPLVSVSLKEIVDSTMLAPHQSSKPVPTYIDIPFCSTVDFSHAWDLKPPYKRSPDGRPEAVTDHKFQVVLSVCGFGRHCQHVTAHFTYVLTNLKRKKHERSIKQCQ